MTFRVEHDNLGEVQVPAGRLRGAQTERSRAAGQSLIPALTELRNVLSVKAVKFREVVIVGRTHLQDAAPLTPGQAISGWAAQLEVTAAANRFAGDNEPGPLIGARRLVRRAAGIAPNRKRIAEHLQSALMRVTGLNPHIGYESSTAWVNPNELTHVDPPRQWLVSELRKGN